MTKSALMDFKSDLFEELTTFLTPEKTIDKKWLSRKKFRKLPGIAGDKIQPQEITESSVSTKLAKTM